MFSFVLSQTISLALRKGGGALGTLAFYVIVFTLFTFALSPEAMQKYALAVLCVALVLASQMAQPLIFERDDEDGTLEQWLIKAHSLEWVVCAKMIGFWLVQLLPVLLAAPLLALVAGLDGAQSLEVALRLLALSPSIVAIGVMTAALTLGSKRGGLLPALISLPLLMPLVIFASNVDGAGGMLLLAAAAFSSVPLGCFVSAAVLRLV